MLTKSCFFNVLAIASGLFLGWLIFRGPSEYRKPEENVQAEESQVWTCAMHPQIRQDNPGKCPLCAMDLTPLKTASPESGQNTDPGAIQLSEEAAALAGIRTTVVRRGNPAREIRLYGTVQSNEQLLHSQVSHVGGRIEKLLVNFTGENVRSGQVIASIYSPELQNAQQELLETVKLKERHPALLEAAREKLRRWKLSDEQISVIEASGEVPPLTDVTANTDGIVVAKNVKQGDYVSPGSVLFSVADLSSVWIMFDAYETDLPCLKTGDHVEYHLQALPGKTFSGKITFIDPILDKTSRTAKIRVETSNPEMQLKPGMYANAVLKASPGDKQDEIIIPKTAVLWTGKRSIVYVKQPESDIPSFQLREIELGAVLGDSCVVVSGLYEGERVVTNGNFTIDASTQLEGKRSMMNTPEGEHVTRVTLKVGGLCVMCKERIEKAAKSVDGVVSATWNQKTQRLQAGFDAKVASLEEISQAVAKSGHDTDTDKADDETYHALPDCCKYRK
jgi:Cu(I)/Ag(I) efflux system membrane fusion protein